MNREEFLRVGAIEDDLRDIAWELEVYLDNLELPPELEGKGEVLSEILERYLTRLDLFREFLIKEVKIS